MSPVSLAADLLVFLVLPDVSGEVTNGWERAAWRCVLRLIHACVFWWFLCQIS